MSLRVAVVYGGKSTEHEISIISAVQAMHALTELKQYEIVPVYLSKENDFYTGEQMQEMDTYRDLKKLPEKLTRVIWVKDGEKVRLLRYPLKKFGENEIAEIDVVFPIVHGTNVEDGTLTGYFATLGLPVAGCDVLSSAVGMNKYVMKTVLKDNGIPVLDCKCFTIRDDENREALLDAVEKAFPYPVIVKPLNLGSSIGIRVAKTREALSEAVEFAFTFARRILVEVAITNLKEVNCAVLGDYEKAIASECEAPAGLDEILSFEDKYMSGGKGSKGAKDGAKTSSGASKGMASLSRKIPADISDEQRDTIRQMAVDAFLCLGCTGVSRIDFMIDRDTDKVYLNEINTIPGSLSFYLWEPAGVPYAALLDRLIELALKQDRENRKLTFSFETNVLEGVKLPTGAKGAG